MHCSIVSPHLHNFPSSLKLTLWHVKIPGLNRTHSPCTEIGWSYPVLGRSLQKNIVKDLQFLWVLAAPQKLELIISMVSSILLGAQSANNQALHLEKILLPLLIVWGTMDLILFFGSRYERIIRLMGSQSDCYLKKFLSETTFVWRHNYRTHLHEWPIYNIYNSILSKYPHIHDFSLTYPIILNLSCLLLELKSITIVYACLKERLELSVLCQLHI